MKRLICGFLAALMLVSMLAVGAVSASAASSLITSEKAIKLLKQMEGFAKKAYWDNSQYSIGYGCSCNPADYPNGITEEEADALLRERLVGMEASVNKFADRYSLKLSQNQFDALMLFTYNCGAGWTNAESDFRNSVINGDSGNEFVYYMTRWCTASGEVSLGLVDRRMAEADLYLYGYYNLRAPSNYGYVLFDANEGTCESRIQGYDASEPVKVRVEPVYTGYRFLGWYTAKEGGKWITDLDSTTMDITLYARWQKDEGNVDSKGNVLGTAANYQRKAGDTLTVYEKPNADSKTVKTLDKGAAITVTADYVDSKGVKWGKVSGGWVVLKDTTVDTVPAAKPQRPAADEDGVSVMVTGRDVNIRSGAGTNYPKVGTANYGQTIVITDTKTVGTMKWGKFSKGWICLMYTNYDSVVENSGDNGEQVIVTGVVKKCGSLRIRSGAGTNYTAIGMLAEGTTVKITQIKQVGSVKWGRISSGWICLDYVTLNDGSGDPDQEKPDDDQDETGDPEKEDDTPGTPDKVTGTVISSTKLNIREGAGTNYKIVGNYARGTQVTILEQKTVGGTPWGRTDKGWISLYYVRLDTDPSGNGGNPSKTMTGTIACNSYLNVRDNPGMNGKVVATLTKGDLVKIYETKLVGTVSWGRINEGWISMNFVKLDPGYEDPNTDPDEEPEKEPDKEPEKDPDTGSTETGKPIATGKVVGANSLRVRSGPGSNHNIVGGLTMGQSVNIYEIKTVNGVAWGRIETGWISMNYVKLNDGGNTVIMVGTVNVNGLRIRSAAGSHNAIVGSYDKGAKVEIYETATVAGQTWGRTDKGWICLSYVV